MPSPRYIIQLDLASPKGRDLDTLVSDLVRRGVQVDTGYPPVEIDPKLQRYVVRGAASNEALREAEKLPGVRFFADSALRGEAAGASSVNPAFLE